VDYIINKHNVRLKFLSLLYRIINK